MKVVLSAFGLLGLLASVAIMVVLWDRASNDLGVAGSTPPASVGAPSSVARVPGAPVGVPEVPDVGGGAQLSPSGLRGPEQSVACATNVRTVQQAAETYKVVNGHYPADVATLVAAGLLDGSVANLQIQVSGDALKVVGIGPCAGT